MLVPAGRLFHIVGLPHGTKFLAAMGEVRYELGDGLIAGIEAGSPAKMGHPGLSDLFPILEECAEVWFVEHQPHIVSFFGWKRVEISNQRCREAIPGEDLHCWAGDDRWGAS